jgi:hypothetical protein
MSDSPAAGASQQVSAFQANMLVVRILRYVDWTKLRDDACGFIELGFDVSRV